MLHVKVKDNESIERALKRFKKKFERTKVLRQVRKRAYYEKPSVARRNERMKAAYKQKMYGPENNA